MHAGNPFLHNLPQWNQTLGMPKPKHLKPQQWSQASLILVQAYEPGYTYSRNQSDPQCIYTLLVHDVLFLPISYIAGNWDFCSLPGTFLLEPTTRAPPLLIYPALKTSMEPKFIYCTARFICIECVFFQSAIASIRTPLNIYGTSLRKRRA